MIRQLLSRAWHQTKATVHRVVERAKTAVQHAKAAFQSALQDTQRALATVLGLLARVTPRLALMAALALALIGVPLPTQAALVSYDGTNVEWSVTDLLTPLTTAIVAAVGAAVVIFTIIVGVRWIFRMVKGSK